MRSYQSEARAKHSIPSRIRLAHHYQSLQDRLDFFGFTSTGVEGCQIRVYCLYFLQGRWCTANPTADGYLPNESHFPRNSRIYSTVLV